MPRRTGTADLGYFRLRARGFRAAAWIVTNKTNGFGLSFVATDAECACGFDRTR